MKNRDRLIALAIVAAVVGIIWWIGARMRAANEAADGAVDGQVSADGAAAATTDGAATSASAQGSTGDGSAAAGDDASAQSAPCRAMAEASKKVLDEARKTRPCTPDPDMSSLGCKTSAKGTWGFRVEEVSEAGKMPDDKCGDTGYLVKLVHIDDNGAEETIIPGVTLSHPDAQGASHTFTISTGYLAAHMSDVGFFDYDGDGEDEVFVRTTFGTYDHIERQESTVFTFHRAATTPDGGAGAAADASAAPSHIVPYPPASSLSIDTVRDVDGDGRPDLLVSVGGGFGATSPPVGIRLAAHSLSDGTFSMHDAAAIAWAQKQCPSDPKLDLSTQTPADFGQKLADEIACSLLWAHDKDLAAGLAKACPHTAEAPAADSGVCPSWTKRLVGIRPPILLR